MCLEETVTAARFMTKVVLINQGDIPHYRIPVYGYLSECLEWDGFGLTVLSCGTESRMPHAVRFDHRKMPLSFFSITKLFLSVKPDVVVLWVNLKNLYLFPVIVLAKFLRVKVVYWGHGRDLQDKGARIKNLVYFLEHWLCDAIILYGEHLKKYVATAFHTKVFVANNTLNLMPRYLDLGSKERILAKYNVKTKKNVICSGRMQKRKRIDDLLKAFELIGNPEFGLILVGPDPEGILEGTRGENVYKLGPVYGDDILDLLSASTVYCLPGAVGLSIVDAFYCGLPFITEEGEETAERMYLKHGVNGFVVSKGDVGQLAGKLKLLLENDLLRANFSRAATDEIMVNGHIDLMCKGFREVLSFVR